MHRHYLLPLGLSLTLAACSAGTLDLGSKDPRALSHPDFALDETATFDLEGEIGSIFGTPAQMAGWVVAALERDSGIARVAEVDTGGRYTLNGVKQNTPVTIALFSPDYLLQAVLAMPGPRERTLSQFFTVDGTRLPTLVQRGQVVVFTNLQDLHLTSDIASDTNGDGIPDGAFLQAAASAARAFAAPSPTATVDTDLDGVPNDRDPDIDGDGIVNRLDSDDNGNGIFDVFDADADGDFVNDDRPGANESNLHYSEGLDFAAVRVDIAPREGNTSLETTITFAGKLAPRQSPPLALQIRGAPALLNGAVVTAVDSASQPVLMAWNRTLADDGQNEDGAARDGLYARRVTLESGRAPRANEAVFFDLVTGTPEHPRTTSFPFVFPGLRVSPIGLQYDGNTRSLLLIGNPFGDIQDFIWATYVTDESNKVIWVSAGVPGTTRQTLIPEAVLQPGHVYGIQLVAETFAKVPGYPAYAVHSTKAFIADAEDAVSANPVSSDSTTTEPAGSTAPDVPASSNDVPDAAGQTAAPRPN